MKIWANRARCLSAGIIAAVLLLTGGCTSTVQQDEAVIHYAIAGAWDSLMPYASVSGSNYSRLVYDKIYDRLCFIHADGTLSPRGADAWESGEDGYVIRFFLNQEAIFHDSTIVTAEHWAKTFAIATNPDCNILGRSNFSILSGTDETGCCNDEVLGVEVEDEFTLVLRLKQPMSPEDFLLTYGREIYVLPTHLLEDIPAAELTEHEIWRSPVGSGPCRFSSEVPGSSITLHAFDSKRWGNLNFSALEIRVVDKANHLSALISGDIDYYAVGNAVSNDNIEFTESQGLAVVQSDAYTNFYELMLNNESISDANIRKAISLSVDRSRLAEHTAGSLGTPTGTYLMPGSSYGGGEATYDPDQASLLVQASDYDGKAYTLATTSARAGLAALMQQDLAAVGISVELVTVDSAALFAGMTAGDYDMAIASHTPSALPLWFVEPRFTADGGVFRTWDETYRTLISAVSRETETAPRQEAMDELLHYLEQETPFVPLFFTRLAYVESPTVSGIEYTASSYSNENVWEWVKE